MSWKKKGARKRRQYTISISKGNDGIKAEQKQKDVKNLR